MPVCILPNIDVPFYKQTSTTSGNLRYIKTLKPWPLKRVMMEKYLYSEADADALGAFLEPMLTADFRKRKPAREMVGHAWLEVTEADGDVGEW
jgi:serine/threonine-protein kinase SRPK3